jgi:hypothetical protein
VCSNLGVTEYCHEQEERVGGQDRRWRGTQSKSHKESLHRAGGVAMVEHLPVTCMALSPILALRDTKGSLEWVHGRM